MTTGLNYSVFPIQQLPTFVPTPIGNVPGLASGLNSVNIVTRYINRLVFDNLDIDRNVDAVTPWDYQTRTILWQLFVGNPNDSASLQTFGMFADQGSVDFVQPIQVQPRTSVTLCLLGLKPSAAPKARVFMAISGGLE